MERFFFQKDFGTHKKLFQYNLRQGSLEESDAEISLQNFIPYSIHGILGSFEFFPFGFFPICVSKCKELSSDSLGRKIFEISLASIFGFECIDMTRVDKKRAALYLSLKDMIEKLINQKGLYFSTNFDLTRRIDSYDEKADKVNGLVTILKF